MIKWEALNGEIYVTLARGVVKSNDDYVKSVLEQSTGMFGHTINIADCEPFDLVYALSADGLKEYEFKVVEGGDLIQEAESIPDGALS